MGVHKFHGKAVRFNGYTDGITVPTGQFRESGVKLLRADYTLSPERKSDATKIGRLHLPSEDNPLNRIVGPFTIDAFIIPDYGGVVVDKPGCFKLQVGDPFKAAPVTFTVHTPKGVIQTETIFNIRALFEANSGTYTGGEHKPDDLTIGAQPLILVTAQYTGSKLRIYLNTELASELSLCDQNITLKNQSSDLFIGGKGGEYRGIIESVRISRGTISPALTPLSITDETVGFWNFNDDIEVPDLNFFANAHASSPAQGRDGPDTHDGNLDVKFCAIGYNFVNFKATTSVDTSIGAFTVRDLPSNATEGVNDYYTVCDRLCSYVTGIPVGELKLHSWYSTGLMISPDAIQGDSGADYYGPTASTSGQFATTLNCIINQSGTDPSTGISKSASSMTHLPADAPAPYTNAPWTVSVSENLDPMVNPIERMKVIAIIPASDTIWVTSVHLHNPTIAAEITAVAGLENLPTHTGFKYHHQDDTPVWFTLGNADLLIDPGNKTTNQTAVANQVTRQRNL